MHTFCFFGVAHCASMFITSAFKKKRIRNDKIFRYDLISELRTLLLQNFRQLRFFETVQRDARAADRPASAEPNFRSVISFNKGLVCI